MLSDMSAKLEEIQKALDMYLETKRQLFPRFYFLSNDDVLEILGQSQNAEAMQPHLKKCFDNINKLRIEKAGKLDYSRHTCIQYSNPPPFHGYYRTQHRQKSHQQKAGAILLMQMCAAARDT